MLSSYLMVVPGTESRILVPRGAVVVSHGTSSVFVMEDGRAVRRAVQPGKELWGQIEIASGLSGGEQLIVKRLEGIVGEKVALKQP